MSPNSRRPISERVCSVSGKVAACGLDVFASEPPGDSPLLTLPNVVASPHNGGYSDVITSLTALTAARRLIAGVGVGPHII